MHIQLHVWLVTVSPTCLNSLLLAAKDATSDHDAASLHSISGTDSDATVRIGCDLPLGGTWRVQQAVDAARVRRQGTGTQRTWHSGPLLERILQPLGPGEPPSLWRSRLRSAVPGGAECPACPRRCLAGAAVG